MQFLFEPNFTIVIFSVERIMYDFVTTNTHSDLIFEPASYVDTTRIKKKKKKKTTVWYINVPVNTNDRVQC